MYYSKEQKRFIFMIILCAGLGGILYGYDIGVISGALLFMERRIELSRIQQELIVGGVLAGGLVGTIITGFMADQLGRRFSILVACVIFTLGVGLMLLAHHFTLLIIGRLLLGVGVGVTAVAIPLYLTEIAPPHIRGRSVTAFQIFLTAGIMTAYLVDLLYTHSHNWRAMFALILIPTVILFVSMLMLPETPRWLLSKSKVDLARETLKRIYPAQFIEQEIALIQSGLQKTSATVRSIFQKQYALPLSIAILIAVLNQCSGVNIVLQYAPKVIDMSGMPNHYASMIATLGIGTMNFLCTLIALILIDSVGRKKLLMLGTAGLVISNLYLASIHYLIPLGSTQAWYTFGGLIVYIASFAIGPGVVVWLAISELLPTRIRGKVIAICLCFNSLTATLLSSTFLTLLHSIGMANVYLLFAGSCIIYFLVARFGLPETRGQELENIQHQFE